MDTLLDAVKNALRMIDGWSGDADTIEALLDEIQAELLRGLGAIVTPDNITPDQQGEVDDFLSSLGLEK